jgi:hypothetical protein
MTIETTLTSAAGLIGQARDTTGPVNALYRKAAIIYSYKTGRALSEYDIAMVELALIEAKIGQRPDIESNFADAIRVLAIASGISNAQPVRLLPEMLAAVEESITDAVRMPAAAEPQFTALTE